MLISCRGRENAKTQTLMFAVFCKEALHTHSKYEGTFPQKAAEAKYAKTGTQIFDAKRHFINTPNMMLSRYFAPKKLQKQKKRQRR